MSETIKNEILRLEKELKRAKTEDEQLRVWKEIGYLEHRLAGRI